MTGNVEPAENVMKRKIGLTGGIASGKSSVASMLSESLGCERIDADEVCSQLLEPAAEGWRALTGVFGDEYLATDGTIDRQHLRKDLFSDEGFRQKVNDIIHPLVREIVVAAMNRIVEAGRDLQVLVEVPLLYEVRWESLFDTIVVVYADNETCLKRLMNRDRVERAAAEKELLSQWPLAEKVLKADHVIDNSGHLPDTNIQVEQLAELLRK